MTKEDFVLDYLPIVACLVYILIFLVHLAVIVSVIWAAFHFIVKFW